MEDGYCVKWEKHHNAVFSVFDTLYQQNLMVDCTLAAEDKFIKAHRIVLMACSPYFEELLSQHSDNYPIILLNIRFIELQALIDFCYRGEVKLPQGDLAGFLNAARLLQIKGLCLSGNEEKRKRDSDFPVSKKRRLEDDVIYSDFDFEDIKPDSVQNGGDDLLNHSVSRVAADSDNSDVDTDDESSSGEGEGGVLHEETSKGNNSNYAYRWSCNRCGEAFPTRNTYTEHRKHCIERREDHTWVCHKCPMTYKNKKDLNRHLQYCGIDTERHVCERCGNTYKYERGLKRHKIYCGTDVKPMICNKCGKTYKYKRGLRRHQKQQCGLDGSPSSVKAANIKAGPAAKKPEPESLPGTPVCGQSCPICGKSYKYRKSFKTHVESCKGSQNEQNTLDNPKDESVDDSAEPMDDSAEQGANENEGEPKEMNDTLSKHNKQIQNKIIEEVKNEIITVKDETPGEAEVSQDETPEEAEETQGEKPEDSERTGGEAPDEETEETSKEAEATMTTLPSEAEPTDEVTEMEA